MEKIAILDCGGQYTKVIDRKVRELAVYSDIFPIDVPCGKLSGYRGIILSGGPNSVWDKNALTPDKDLFSLGIPILGICYGMQLINHFFGGVVSPHEKKEYGESITQIDADCPLFKGLKSSQTVLMSHGDTVKTVAEGFKVCAKSEGIITGIYDEKRAVYGVQFHPEVDLTENGLTVFENFLRNLCCLKERYTMRDRIQASIDNIRETAGDSQVVVLVSGGVDSAVTAALLLKALKPEQIIAIHIDHGLMRKDESDLVCEDLKKQGLLNLIRINAKNEFFYSKVNVDGRVMKPLSETTDPEEKRAIIGQIFFDTVQKAAAELKLDFETSFLAQGTLRPDLIESGNPDVSSFAKKIKTHHNDVGIIRKFRDNGRIIETNSDWHKDEVRQVARMLGLDEKIASRQPFPGPGLGVRIICDEKEQLVDSGIEAALNNLCGKAAAARLLPVRSVGVQGDNRSYGLLAMLKPSSELDWDKLYSLSKDITNEIKETNRLALCLGGDFDGKIMGGDIFINDTTVSLLRELDHMVTQSLKGITAISQAFAVLMAAGVTKKYSVAVRCFVTNDFMTGRPAFIGKEIPTDTLTKLAADIKTRFNEIEFVIYDITSKPPATCEWE